MYNAGFADVVDKVDVADFVFPRGGEAPGGVPLTLLLCARRYMYFVDVANFVFPRGGEAPGGVPLTILLCARRYVH